jgi:Ni/Fe-hydrogenase 1 B-type cytochrome subunit
MTAAKRIMHWLIVIATIACIATGLYIGNPYYMTDFATPAVYKYVMAYNRLIHLFSAILLDVIAIATIYLFFFSRFKKTYKKVLPTTENVKEFFAVIVNLLTLNRKKEFDSKNADSFNAVYFVILEILLLLQMFTGLQLYVGSLSGDTSLGAWWPWLLHLSTDWTNAVFGQIMGVRIAHHQIMWIIICWVMFHIYYQVWRTIFWQEGDIAIVFGGDKFVRKS